MKNLKLMAVIVSFAAFSLSFTVPNNPDTKVELRNQIVKMLGNVSNDFTDNNIKTEVVFTLNAKSEIVIVSVESHNSSVDTYVKSKLNYKKVKVSDLNQGKIYRMPLVIKGI
tara:strand:+ start:382890 stop:383225 length:336 start_codon:yes stop_codon:yes gene_type:complete